jgi:tripartite-type tricarboxylate transporter receptor subunit TctC
MTLKISNRRSMLAAGAALLAAPMGRAFAAGDIGGGKPITLLVSYPAGGGADVMARLMWRAQRLTD